MYLRIGIIIFAVILLISLVYMDDGTTKIEGYRVQRLPDRFAAAGIMKELIRRVHVLIHHLDVKYYSNGIDEPIDDDVGRLIKRFNVRNISEISPNNKKGMTSYTKGKKDIMLCLRDKNNDLHDINTLMFVVLHEITHMMNNTWNHDKKFWTLFRIVLKESVECGIYTAVDYSVEPKKYCGIMIDNNPLFM